MMLNTQLRLVCGARNIDDIPPSYAFVVGTGRAVLLVMQPEQQFLGVFAKLQKVTVSFLLSVHPHGTWLPLNKFWWNFMLGTFYYNLLRKSKFGQNWTRISGTLRKDLSTVGIANSGI
jgi:hypothetical protein